MQIAKHDFYSIHPYYTRTNKEIVDFAHKQNLKVIVWTVNSRRAMKKLIEIANNCGVKIYSCKAAVKARIDLSVTHIEKAVGAVEVF